MRKSRVAAFLVFVSVLCVSVFSLAASYPKPVGYVNDFAKIIPGDVEKKLESELREYEKKTSIEIAVVTVSSLEGETVEDYTIGLAKSWGVGKKGKDNGIVFLVAPNERKMRIEVGYGLEPDMPDSAAGRVIRDGVIPFFKQAKTALESGDTKTYQAKMADGVVVGVAEILKTLGDKPYQARLEERRAAEEKARRESEKSRESFKNFMMIAGLVLGTGLIFAAIVWGIKNIMRHRQQLKTLYGKNAHTLADAVKKIVEAEEEYPKALEKIELLKKDNPKEVWQELERMVSSMPQQIKKIKEQIEHVRKIHGFGWKFSEKVRGPLENLLTWANEKSSYLEMVKAKIDEVRGAKNRSVELIKSIPAMIEKISDKVSHPDVSADTRKIFNEAKNKHKEAVPLLNTPPVNWLLVFGALSAVSLLLSKAESAAMSDKTLAEKARKEGPKLLKELPASIKEAEEKVSHSDVSRSTKNKVEDAKKKYEGAKKKASGSPVDWLMIFTVLTAVASLLDEANKGASSDKAVAKRRRDDDSYHSSSWSSSSSSSSYDSGSSFGGFGGGSFGGGGASGSW